MNEQTTVLALYSKLLRFYPRLFQEQLGESMEQTFQDLYRERREKDCSDSCSGHSSKLRQEFLESIYC